MYTKRQLLDSVAPSGGSGSGTPHGRRSSAAVAAAAVAGQHVASLEPVALTPSVTGLYLARKRHLNNALLVGDDGQEELLDDWRMRARMRTVGVGIVLCLNIGIDPPDVMKTDPCARLECWIDPYSMASSKAMEAIGARLQQQYERWQRRARYKQSLDSTLEDVKKLCSLLRKTAKEERVLFHYNGHGVPRPTPNAEVWVFNKGYTQYIPLSLYDLQAWLGTPSIYVFDCHNAAITMAAFLQHRPGGPTSPQDLALFRDADVEHVGRSAIVLAACREDELLPMHPQYPADLFTCCLTTPIKMALRWFARISMLHHIDQDLLDAIPGDLYDRRTPLGELNWIFTTVTDTIAWNVLPSRLFHLLFRQDVLLASLFRNFLLAERVMTSAGVHPVSYPPMPSTLRHPMWAAWDMACELCLSQLTRLVADPHFSYTFSSFFADQLTAFEVWLDMPSCKQASHPEQLPIVLQVLLSQAHRLRALVLLARFLDLGHWAVSLALSVGIFPYVLKLLQSQARELRPVLVFIWTKILAFDLSCQHDLVKDAGHEYFLRVLDDQAASPGMRSLAAFVLSAVMRDNPSGQQVCLEAGALERIAQQTGHSYAPLRRWCCLALGSHWHRHRESKVAAMRLGVMQTLIPLLADPFVEIRAAVVWAIGSFIGCADDDGAAGSAVPQAMLDFEFSLAMSLVAAASDSSPLVRRELLFALARLVAHHQVLFRDTCIRHMTEQRRRADRRRASGAASSQTTPRTQAGNGATPAIASTTAAAAATASSAAASSSGTRPRQAELADSVWAVMVGMSYDPFPQVAKIAAAVVQQLSHVCDDAALGSSSSSGPGLTSPGTSNGTSTGNGSSGGGVLAVDVASFQLPSLHRPMLLDAATRDAAVAAAWAHTSTTEARTPATAGVRRARRIADVAAHATMAAAVRAMDAAAASGNGSLGTSVSPSGVRVMRRASSRDLVSTDDDDMASVSSSGSNHTSVSMRSGSAGASPSRLDRSGNGMAASVAPPAPMVSTLYTWYRREMRRHLTQPCSNDVDESFDEKPTRARARIAHHQELRVTARLDAEARSHVAFHDLIGTLSLGQQDVAALLQFHPFEPLLVVGDDRSGLSVWNWSTGRSWARINNGNRSGTRVTSLALGNTAAAQALLFVASSDGSVRVWRQWDVPRLAHIVSAWRVVPDVRAANRRNTLVLDWHQHCGSLVIGTDSPILRVWDMARETCFQELEFPPVSDASSSNAGVPATPSGGRGAGESVTCLGNAQRSDDANMFIAGGSQGSVVLYDRRAPPSFAAVQQYRSSSAWIAGVSMQHESQRCIASADMDGNVFLYDARNSVSPIRHIDGRGDTTAMAMHDYTPIFAVGSSDQYVRVADTDGNVLDTLRFHDGFLGQRIGPIASLAFHPLHPVLAAGATDGVVSVYQETTASQRGTR